LLIHLIPNCRAAVHHHQHNSQCWIAFLRTNFSLMQTNSMFWIVCSFFIKILLISNYSVLWWGDHMYIDMDFSVRQFFLKSKLEELESEDAKNSRKFVHLPSCLCSLKEITKFMEQEFPYELDGLLFYYNSVQFY